MRVKLWMAKVIRIALGEEPDQRSLDHQDSIASESLTVSLSWGRLRERKQ